MTIILLILMAVCLALIGVTQIVQHRLFLRAHGNWRIFSQLFFEAVRRTAEEGNPGLAEELLIEYRKSGANALDAPFRIRLLARWDRLRHRNQPTFPQGGDERNFRPRSGGDL